MRIVTGDGTHVADIVHEVVVRALDSIHRYDPARPLRPWLCGIAIKVCHKHWRRLRRARRTEAALVGIAGGAAAQDSNPETELAARESLVRLRRALDELSPTLRETLLLACCEEYSTDEVAQMTGTTANAVYTRICRARELLRRRLRGPDGGGNEVGR